MVRSLPSICVVKIVSEIFMVGRNRNDWEKTVMLRYVKVNEDFIY